MAEERIEVVYKVEIIVDKEDFGEKEKSDIRKIAEKRMAKIEGKTRDYLRDNLEFLQLELSDGFKWSKGEVDKIRIRRIKVKQILPKSDK